MLFKVDDLTGKTAKSSHENLASSDALNYAGTVKRLGTAYISYF
jgi:hypothetical protein